MYEHHIYTVGLHTAFHYVELYTRTSPDDGFMKPNQSFFFDFTDHCQRLPRARPSRRRGRETTLLYRPHRIHIHVCRFIVIGTDGEELFSDSSAARVHDVSTRGVYIYTYVYTRINIMTSRPLAWLIPVVRGVIRSREGSATSTRQRSISIMNKSPNGHLFHGNISAIRFCFRFHGQRISFPKNQHPRWPKNGWILIVK